MKSFVAHARTLWRSLWRSDELDAAMSEEMRFHIDMEAERLMRERQIDSQEARRQAHVAFGGLARYQAEGRDARGLQWIDAMILDARLGLRLLVKYRWLTLVGGFAMAIAIAVGASAFEVISEVLNPTLPLEDGDRIVALQYVATDTGNPERRVLREYSAWRNELVSVEQLGAFRTVQHNLVTGNAPPEPVRVAEISASGFDVARTPPLAGRYLVFADERIGAPPVVVIGYEAWRVRFGGDPQIVGQRINLGGLPHTVVGVMPDGFKFPVDHQFWIPLRVNPLMYDRLQGPELYMFGRLVSGVTLEHSQAELTGVGQRLAAAHPATHERLRPVVLPYTREHLDLTQPGVVWALRIAQILIGALSFVVSVNVAILIYTRTITRLGEIAVRTALGASRLRILSQLFVEGLALSAIGAAAGLLLAHVALDRIQRLLPANGSLPFWLAFELSTGTVMFALALTVLAAFVMGVMPGIKATGGGLQANMRELHSRTGTPVGPVWTSLVVAQVAVAVAVLPVAAFLAWQVVRMETGPGFAAGQYVVGTVALSDDRASSDSNRVRGRQLEMIARLEQEPGVSAVTFSSSVPGFAPDRRIQFERGAPLRITGMAEVNALDVAVEMFDVYGAQILAGRAFSEGDLGAANAAIVNRTFVQQFVDSDQSALGLRFRYSGARRPESIEAGRQPDTKKEEWHQIVGVVSDFPRFRPAPTSEGAPTVYHPAAPGEIYPFTLSVRFNGPVPAGFIERFRKIGAEVDPALQVRRAQPLSEFYDQVRSGWRYLAWGIGLVTLSVLLLSAAGIYAMMSFTVEQRTREIGIRSALGAAPHRLFMSVFGRATRQLGLGLLIGSLLSGAVLMNTSLSLGRATALWLTVAATMLVVGLLAALGPARRGVLMQAAEALREGANTDV